MLHWLRAMDFMEKILKEGVVKHRQTSYALPRVSLPLHYTPVSVGAIDFLYEKTNLGGLNPGFFKIARPVVQWCSALFIHLAAEQLNLCVLWFVGVSTSIPRVVM